MNQTYPYGFSYYKKNHTSAADIKFLKGHTSKSPADASQSPNVPRKSTTILSLKPKSLPN